MSSRTPLLVVGVLILAFFVWTVVEGGEREPGATTDRDRRGAVDSESASAELSEVDATGERRHESPPAGVAPDDQSQPSAAAPVDLAGRVVDAEGTGVGGAFVVLGGTGSLSFVDSGDEPPEGVRWVRSEPDGSFAFDDAPDGILLVTAGAKGFAPSETLLLPEEARPTDALLRLRRGVRIYGYVQRQDGSLATDRKVRFLQEEGSQDATGKRLLRWAVTDDQGRFDERNLCPGAWGLVTVPDREEIRTRGSSGVEGMVQANTVLEDGEEAMIALGAPPASAVEVTGHVAVEGGHASGFLQWMIEGPNALGSQKNVAIDDEGRYAVTLESHGSWYVRAMGSKGHGEFVVDVPKGERFEHDFVLPSGAIVGVVQTVDGTAINGARVSLLTDEGTRERGAMRIGYDQVSTDADGAYRLDGLPPGTYVVGAVHPDEGVASSIHVLVAKEELVNAPPLEMRGGRSVSGTITLESGLSAPHAPIWIHDERGEILNPVTSTRTNENGEFTTPRLPDGTYSFFVQSGLEVALETDIVVQQSALEDLEIQLAAGAAFVTECFDGEERVRAHVRVYDEKGRLLTGLRDKRNPWAWRRYPVDSMRRHMGPLPPGTYKVQAFAPGVGSGSAAATIVGPGEQELRLRLR